MQSGIVWNKGLLLAWLIAAEIMVPGISMPYHNHVCPLLHGASIK